MEMLERATAAARGATDAYAAGDGLWMLEGGVRSDAFFRDIVRAVLTELREPSPEMLGAGYSSYDPYEECAYVPDVWRAMIDAALEPSSPAAGR